jgi:hypothetical protein
MAAYKRALVGQAYIIVFSKLLKGAPFGTPFSSLVIATPPRAVSTDRLFKQLQMVFFIHNNPFQYLFDVGI